MQVQRSAGAIVLVRTDQGLRVVLKRRGKKDNYPNACQEPVHGKCEKYENFFAALIRESHKKLGSDFTERCLDEAVFRSAHRRSYGDKEIMTYYLFVPEIYLKLIELEEDSGKIELVEPHKFFDGSILKITPEKKKVGYSDSVIAMFSDEIIAIKKVLEKEI